jgi:hypothetical protein
VVIGTYCTGSCKYSYEWIVLRWILYGESLICRNLKTNAWHFHFWLFRNVETKWSQKLHIVFGQMRFFILFNFLIVQKISVYFSTFCNLSAFLLI